MKKKQYFQPTMEMVALRPTTVICVSITPGPPIGGGEPPEYTD